MLCNCIVVVALFLRKLITASLVHLSKVFSMTPVKLFEPSVMQQLVAAFVI